MAQLIIGGEKLFAIVVEDAATADAILEQNEQEKNLTIIPMREADCKHKIPEHKIAIAQALYGNDCIPAIQAIIYGQPMHNVLHNIFGNVFICRSNEIAKQISRNEQLRLDTITLDGQRHYGDGTIESTHEIPWTASILNDLEEIRVHKLRLTQIGTELEQMATYIDTIQAEMHHQTELNIEMANNEKELLEINERNRKLSYLLNQAQEGELRKTIGEQKYEIATTFKKYIKLLC